MSTRNPVSELAHALHRCVLIDRSDLGRLIGDGADLLDLLQRLSTGNVIGIPEGHGRTTVLTTPKGRIVEHLWVTRLESGVLLIAGPGNGPRVLEHLRKFTFSEETGLADVGIATRLFVIAGPRAADALEAANLPRPTRCGSVRSSVAGCSVDVIGHGGESDADFSILVGKTDDGPAVWAALEAAVCKSGGAVACELARDARRVLLGIPVAGRELTEEYNPLEAGLNDAVAFDKGCYVGQEVIARLNTYDKVSRALLGLVLGPDVPTPESGSPLFHDGAKIGTITSSLRPPGGARAVALGYVKIRSAGPGSTVHIGSTDGPQGELVKTPFDLRVAGVQQ